MKIIVRNSDNVSLLSFADEVTITPSDDAISIQVGEETRVYQEFNSSNATVYENLTLPDDYTDRKYKYDGSSFTANSEWADPSVSILTMDKNRYVQMNTFSDTFIAAVQTEIDRLNG
jgi:hypothetical protein